VSEHLGFRRSTLLWLLVAAFVIGLGVRAVQLIRGHALSLPVALAKDDALVRNFKQRADSLMAERLKQRNASININTATAADFESLDGIGPVLAARIVAYREQHGPFVSVDELDSVSGIGPKRLAAVRGRCMIDSLTVASSSGAQ
jgi:competence ComEA-like helix-hairpin-helix protein